MDPNAALVALRELAQEEVDKGEDAGWAEWFQALDKWLTDSGFLPEAWCGASAAPRPGRHAHAIMMPCAPGCPGWVEGRR
jgi:hypothetical protein